MKGLLLKDFYNVRNLLVYFALFFILFLSIFVITASTYFYSFSMIFIPVWLVASTVSYDAQDKWERYAISSGVSRNAIVRSKYIFSLIIILTIMVFVLIFGFATGWKESHGMLFAFSCFFNGVLCISIVLPCFFRFEVEKARVIYMIIVFIALLAVALLSAYMERWYDIVRASWLIAVFALLSAAVLAVSYFVSLRIYRKREFN